MKRFTSIGVAVLVVLVGAATCRAQDGVITGRVNDASGAPLPGVGATLTSTSVMGIRSVVTDDQGGYRFGLLPPGAYTVKFELAGFGTIVREGIQLTAGFTSTLNVAMNVAPLAETITVRGDSPIIDV